MSNEVIKEKIRPFYSEFQGYLAQAPEINDIRQRLYDQYIWSQYNDAVELLGEIVGEPYVRFIVQTTTRPNDGKEYVVLFDYRQKLGGLISRLHAEYFQDEPVPFEGMPSTIITQTQQQNQSIQMYLDIQSKIDENLSKIEEGSKEEGFLKKFKSKLSSVSNVNELFKLGLKVAKDFEINISELLKLWS